MADDDEKTPLLTVKDGGMPPKGDLSSFLNGFLDVHGNNFLGSGTSYIEWLQTARFLQYERSFCTQTREEKTRRMGYIVRLSAEQERLVARERFATRWSELAIEAVIDGDWNTVDMWIKELRFEKESPELQELAAANFAKFVEILQETYDTRPKIFCPVCRKPPSEADIKSWVDGRHVCSWCDVVFDDDGKSEPKGRARLKSVDGGRQP